MVVGTKRYTHRCLKCDYAWQSTHNHPVRCANPKCRIPGWWMPRILINGRIHLVEGN